ncbi:Oncoprotein-induced transcript 3 protein [Desmophyllum pertusum]|uniref:Oncoprotein-induced transcript 3 protein n=1 Tax=Desmophyllum pertusum TaxID=174260 RepID=A0A9W9YMQ3_9CNID|nr:Oncoprotein-induced transcript 3 protein [Desmophyllum pertusum]
MHWNALECTGMHWNALNCTELQGSVISSFNVSYPGVDGLQIVALQEEIAGGSLGNTPADLLSITTKNVPAEAPVILESNSTTSTTIDLKWSNVTQLNSAPELLGYVIVYKEMNKKFQGDIMKSVSPTPPEAVLKELKKFTNYTIRVYAFTKNGNGVPSEAAHVRTQEDGNPCELDDYKDLNQSGRSVNYTGGTHKCDYEDLQGTWDSWYKVSGAAGNALASKNPLHHTCGTKLRLYLRDDHPAFSDGEVTQTVCVASNTQNNSCNNQRNIQVVNCGAFYLYKLVELRSGCGATRLYTWRYCTNGETDDKCVSVICAAGKLCSLTDNGHQHQCVDDNGPCSTNPCKNGGTCNTNSGSFTCSCRSGYTGDNCSTSSLQNACLYKPCTNGDICNTNATGGYTCSPPPDACLYKRCHNGGTCNSNFTSGGFTCTCPVGYNGDTCALGDPCPKWFPCQNGATCSPIWNWPHFKCSCPSRYIGYKCETKLGNTCTSQPARLVAVTAT